MLTMLFQQSSHSYPECRVCWCHIWWSGRRKSESEFDTYDGIRCYQKYNLAKEFSWRVKKW